MTDANRPTRNWKSGAWGAALAVLLAVFQPFAPWLADLSYDLPFIPRGKTDTSEAVIIAMDEDAHKELRQPMDAPWDRAIHARLIRHLAACGARAIVMDIWFDEPSSNDTVLVEAVQAVKKAGIPVVIGGTILDVASEGHHTGKQFLPPTDALTEVVAWGWAEQGEEDEILRTHYRGTEDYRGNWAPSLAWRAAELTASREILPPAAGRRWINYYGPSGAVEHRSYHAVLNTNLVRASLFANKVCFVGAFPPKTPYSGPVRVDIWPTPFSRLWDRKTPGVEVTATVYLNLLHGDWLERVAGQTQLLIFVLTGLLFGWGLTLVRPVVAASLGAAGIMLVAVLAFLLMAGSHIWFSWLTIALVQIPVSIGWSVLTNSKRLAREKEALATQLAAAQTALKEVATAAGEAATRVDPSTRGTDGRPAAEVPAIISRGAVDGRPVIPDHDLVRCVGKGAYGEVWLARNVIGTYHAVKIVKRDDFQSNEPFEREFKGIQKFMPISRSHPGFVQILHAGRNQSLGYIYYIMETADDETTAQRIEPDTYKAKNLAREIKNRGHLPAAECLQLSLDLTAALDYLHQQHLIHRDIKPSNIIFVKGVPKFADIGLVTDIAPTGRETTFLGTYGYIPPEGPGTPGADVFSLGKVLYEASTGRGCESFPEMSSTIRGRSDSAEHFQLNQIILKACQDQPDQRYRTAAEMRADLLELQARAPAVRPT